MDDLDRKVQQMFAPLVGRVENIGSTKYPREVVDAIVRALGPTFTGNAGPEIAFHVSDWVSSAAFLVALHLFPDRFTDEEVDEGIRGFLIHAPNHVAAAAKLYGCPVQDIFEVGALDGHDDEA